MGKDSTNSGIPGRRQCLKRSETVHGKEAGPDMEPEENDQPQDEEELPLIDPEMFYDLLMEQQEQM